MKRAIAFVSLVLLALPDVPLAFASVSAESGVFSRTIVANGLTLNVTTVYRENWNWDQSNTVQVTISRVSGAGNASVLMIDESGVLHRNDSDFVLATSKVEPTFPNYSLLDLAKPISLTFTFSNESHASNAEQGKVYSAHISVSVDMLVISNKASTHVPFADGPGDMLVTLSTEQPIARTQSGSLLLLAATEAIGFAGILFIVKATKMGDSYKSG